jgi:hypothetical protein
VTGVEVILGPIVAGRLSGDAVANCGYFIIVFYFNYSPKFKYDKTITPNIIPSENIL